VSLAAICIAAWPGQSLAQGTGGQAAVGGTVLEEVMVTALKREESLQSVPVSVTALTTARLDDLKLDDASALVTQIPNLQVNGIVGEASPVFSLRGISMFDYSLNQSSPVAAYVDEVSKGNFAIFGVELYDLARVEVLRGPQGTLYGKNTTGGAINFITRQPDFEADGFLKAGVGNFGRYEVQGAFGGPLVDERLAGRVAFTYAKSDGWFQSVGSGPDMQGVDQYGVRVALLLKANDDLDFLLRLSSSRQRPVNYGVLAFPGPDGVGAGVFAAFNAADPVTNPDTDYFRTGLRDDQIEVNYTPERRQDNDAVALTINWSLSEGVALTSITSWDDGELFNPEDTDGAPIEVLEIPYTGKTRQVAQDLRLTSTGDGPFNFIVGAYGSDEKIFNSTELRIFQGVDANFDGAHDAQDCIDDGLLTCGFYNQFDQTRQSWAAYTDLSFATSARIKLRLGMRYTDDSGTQKNFYAQVRGSDGVPLANLIPGDPNDLFATARRELSDSQLTGRVGLDYTTAGDALLYLGYSTGYRSSAFNAQAFFDPSELTVAEPENMESIEAGIKSQWLEGRLQLNGALFHYKYEDQQVIDIDPVTLAQPLVNLGESSVTGAELELVAQPASAFTLRGGFGWLDSNIERATLRGLDIAGNELPNAPELTASLSFDWDVATWQTTTLAFQMSGNYVAAQFFEPFNIDRLEQEAYTLVNARIALRANDGVWELGAWGNNLTDEFYLTSAVDLLGGFGYDYSHRGAPRSYGLEATWHY
jgi:iron complex outermembrane receptor protein